MTREEAIIVLKYGMKYRNPKNDTEKDRNEALDMAISALSENKGDLISRQAVLELLQMKYFGKDLYKAIYELPSVENKGEWIPVSERLPENDTEVVYQSERGGVGSCHYYNGFNNYPNTDPDCIFTDIVAWIPIPEPYKADMRGE